MQEDYVEKLQAAGKVTKGKREQEKCAQMLKSKTVFNTALFADSQHRDESLSP